MTEARDLAARLDWRQRIYRRLTDTQDADPGLALPAPANLRATSGIGHIRLDWEPVPGAAGYLIERTDADDDPQILDHGGRDVPAVPGPPFADTGLADGQDYGYRVAAVAGAEFPAWAWSDTATGRVAGGDPGVVDLAVRADTVTGHLDRVWRMVGSERLTQLLFGDDGHGNPIGEEFEQALRIAREELGVEQVRAHAILHDDNHVVRAVTGGRPDLDFSAVDELYDRLLGLGLRPVVELSFMPAALARDPGATVFTYRGIISPPRYWSQWHDLVRALAAHLVERYGLDEVAGWAFEVWNEPNLEVFWTGTRQEYLQLYTEAAAAVKSVHPRLRIGGPATAAGEWLEELAAHAERTGTALDFVSTHTYGNLPLDPNPTLRRHGLAGIPAWWTEWGAGSTHYGAIHDSVAGAPFVLSGYQEAQGRLDALAYWVISDHFEELGRPPALFHNGFGLLTVFQDPYGRVRELLETVGLTPPEQFAAKLPHLLSGGQRQRVVIARALACEPELIVADEPVSMLDVSLRAGILRLLAALRAERGLSLLYITHDLLSARVVTDQIAVLHQGRIVEQGPTAQVLRHPEDEYTVRLLDAVPNPFAAKRSGAP